MRLPACLPAKKTQITKSPPMISQIDGDSPAHDGPSAFGWIQPHARTQDAEDEHAQAECREHRADDIELRGCSTGASAIRRVSSRMIRTITTSPANTQRHEK